MIGLLMLKSFVVGGAGFIGSHLVETLIERGPVTVFDNLSQGRRESIQSALGSGAARIVLGDTSDQRSLEAAMAGHDVVFHLAANTDPRAGLTDSKLDLEQGTRATHHVLEAMRKTGTKRIAFASSAAVYGNADRNLVETDLGSLPVSLYGASKLGSEAMLSAFVECFALQGYIFRFGSVVGPRSRHGVVHDFFHKLKADPDELEVLGDGRQSQSYVHVSDCVAGMLFALDCADAPLNIFNVAPSDVTSVQRVAELCILASPFPSASIRFTGAVRGFLGDVRMTRLNTEKLAKLGFRVARSSDEAIADAAATLSREVFGG